MFLTKRQAEQVAKQGRNDFEKIVKILRSMDFCVMDGVGFGKRGTGIVMVPNFDGSFTRFVRGKKGRLIISIDKPERDPFE